MPLLGRFLGRKKVARKVGLESSGQGFFQNANHAMFNGPVAMTDHSITNISYIEQGKPVLEALAQKMTPGADVDSSVRYPPPKCYPGTRVTLTTKVQNWLFDDYRSWETLWLHGPAGVGKSAVAQTIAEFARDNQRLGAAFFFSKPNGRHLPQPVFITLAYQLAVRVPGYLPLVAKQLAADPDLLTKAPPVQFKKLIIEPLSLLADKPKYLIVLDGLDECEGEQAQLDIIELINNLILSRTSLPIIWMICSRPEPHIVNVLSRADFAVECWREELAIDSEESRDDNAKFIRARFREMNEKYRDCVEQDDDGCWPSEGDTMQIITEASGLFAFADTVLKYIEDPRFGQPNSRLATILAVIKHSHVAGIGSPMGALDLLYTRILSEVPIDIWPVTRRLLSVSIGGDAAGEMGTPWCLSNLLGITRSDFYSAVRKLHSILDIPPPDKAEKESLRFFHKSLSDYLVDFTRSGRFCVLLPPDFGIDDEAQKSSLRFISTFPCFICADSLWAKPREKAQLSETQRVQVMKRCLTWPPSDLVSAHSNIKTIIYYARRHVFSSNYCKFKTGDDQHQQLKSMLHAFDFNSLTFVEVTLSTTLPYLIGWTKRTSLCDLARTHSTSETDGELLSRVAEIGVQPLDFDHVLKNQHLVPHTYCLLGYDKNTILASVSEDPNRVTYWSSKSPSEVWPSLSDLLAELENGVLE